MTTPTNLETLFLQLINVARANTGARALTFDGELLDSSDAHSAWMDATDTFSHTGVNGSSPGDRMASAGYGAQGWGENIAYVSGDLTEATVRQLHTNLMNSPGHYANIVNGSFEEIGIGLKEGTINGYKVVFVTQNFGTPNATERAEPDDVGTVTPPPTGGTIMGTSGNDVLAGTSGNDAMYGSTGNDTYYINQTGDKAYELAGQGTDTVISTISYSLAGQVVENLTLTGSVNLNGTGNSLGNTLIGNAGANTLSGDAGRDVLNGKGGQDILIGGAGNDTFVFDTAPDANGDTINDFVHGADRISLKAIDASTRAAGDQAFTFIGAQAFHKVAGELQAYQAGGNTYVAGDVNGDGAADFAIKILGVHSFAKADFVL
ncbi:CAP domain-containing protein [Microvirga rosea]|uniref:CAP domain-containing protein n=1 Tax=Microvirga rosea TaxID=2715425 RepID=UPI001D0A1811|nr:CAP domain-containing protein [Microvirga rosea]MCB8819467.1 CAP domain-containing protein [Microvirga rosea]